MLEWKWQGIGKSSKVASMVSDWLRGLVPTFLSMVRSSPLLVGVVLSG